MDWIFTIRNIIIIIIIIIIIVGPNYLPPFPYSSINIYNKRS
jgi:Sec-independent protein translocase protein TatA